MRRQYGDRFAQPLAFLSRLHEIARFIRLAAILRALRLYPLLAVVEPYAIDGARARLVHDPAEYGPVLRVIARSASPDIEEHIERDLFGRFALAGDAHGECEDEAMGPLV